MKSALIVAAQSLERKADAAKAKAEQEANLAVTKNDSTKLQLAVLEGMRANIYREVAESLREAAAQDGT